MIIKYLRVFTNFFISSLFILFLSVIISGSAISVVVFGYKLSSVFSLLVLSMALLFLLFLGACGCIHLYNKLVEGIMDELKWTEDQASVEAGMVTFFIILMGLISLIIVPVITGMLFFAP